MFENNTIIFSVHKAASTLLFHVLKGVSSEHGIPLYSPNHKGGEFKILGVARSNSEMSTEFPKQPCLVGPIRRPCTFTNLPNYKSFIHLRDPRDIMTSMFFSWSYSHGGIKATQREEWIEMGIDKFVTEKHVDMLERFKIYCDWIKMNDHVHLSTYEELYNDFEAWLTRFFEFIGIEDEALVAKLAAQSDPQKIFERGEDQSSHTRQARPGDYAQKLSKETIALLNERFAFYFDMLEQRYSDTGYR